MNQRHTQVPTYRVRIDLSNECQQPAAVIFHLGQARLPRCAVHAGELRVTLLSLIRRESWEEEHVV